MFQTLYGETKINNEEHAEQEEECWEPLPPDVNVSPGASAVGSIVVPAVPGRRGRREGADLRPVGAVEGPGGLASGQLPWERGCVHAEWKPWEKS